MLERGRSTLLNGLAVVTVILGVTAILIWSNRHAILAGLFGPPETTLTEAYGDLPGGAAFDHSTLDALLGRHVDEGGWIDYEGLRGEVAALDRYIESVAGAPLGELDRDEILALLINAYNAFTLKLLLEHYPIAGIRDIPSARRWEAVRWSVGGEMRSLNQIEHEWIRPGFREPRTHFALVCGAVGCPPLRNEAYASEQLERQLREQAEYVHRHATWFRLDGSRGVVGLTQLYLWYAGDFEQVAGGVLEFASRFSPELRATLQSGDRPEIAWLDYDWKLNSSRNRRPR